MEKITRTLSKILNILPSQQYISASELSEKTALPQYKISYIIKLLVSYGVKIINNHQLGYKKEDELILLDKNKILQESDQIKLDIFDCIYSTQQFLKNQNIEQYDNHVCLAEYQTTGNGRMHKHWYSSFGQNLLFSIKMSFRRKFLAVSSLTLVLGLTVIKILEPLILPNRLMIKWPNDIYYKDKKIAGILTEVITDNANTCNVIIGLGLNVNMTTLQKLNMEQWTSLKKITSKNFDRNNICTLLINNIIHTVKAFNKLDHPKYLPDWHQYDYLFGKKIDVSNGSKSMTGISKGINSDGYLLLEIKNRTIIPIYNAEVSVIR